MARVERQVLELVALIDKEVVDAHPVSYTHLMPLNCFYPSGSNPHFLYLW